MVKICRGAYSPSTKAIMSRKFIDTVAWSHRFRKASLDIEARRFLITNFRGSAQEQDFTEPANCGGFGRVRHFRRETSPGWPTNPLPIDPACHALRLPRTDVIRAQAFQNAACNWRCWYCFVPFNLLSANTNHADWLSADQLLDLYLAESDPPVVIDLTGGQPDLIPEWVVWTIDGLKQRNLAHKVYLWSDDNLSNDYFWRHLTDNDRATIKDFENYGRVGCFKGFDPESFSFNTEADPCLYDQQFALMKRFLGFGIDTYAYATFTTPSSEDVQGRMHTFVDRLQEVDHNLPLRTIPLEVREFSPVKARVKGPQAAALRNQQMAIAAWQEELSLRFSTEERDQNVSTIPVGGRTRE
jgi:uncharacterized Fe-S cluster-containing radical SAM superfamily protein